MYNADNDVARLLREEQREQKQAGRGIFSRTASRRGGCKGAMAFPADRMTRAERKHYTKASDVTVSMYIPSLEELNALPFNEAQGRYQAIKSNFKNDELVAYWKLPNKYQLYKLDKKYGSPHPRKSGRPADRVVVAKAIETIEEVKRERSIEDILAMLAESERRLTKLESPSEVAVTGTVLVINGEYDGTELGVKLTNLGNFLELSKSYEITLTIKEK